MLLFIGIYFIVRSIVMVFWQKQIYSLSLCICIYKSCFLSLFFSDNKLYKPGLTTQLLELKDEVSLFINLKPYILLIGFFIFIYVWNSRERLITELEAFGIVLCFVSWMIRLQDFIIVYAGSDRVFKTTINNPLLFTYA